jgi:hypothetical protein
MAETGPRSIANMVFVLILTVLFAGGVFFTWEMIRDAMS